VLQHNLLLQIVCEKCTVFLSSSKKFVHNKTVLKTIFFIKLFIWIPKLNIIKQRTIIEKNKVSPGGTMLFN
jgi:hypothetical protein